MPVTHELRFDGQTAVITGAGAGLGRAYALYFASKGANVVVNDLGGGPNGGGRQASASDEVVRLIEQDGGHAVADYHDVSTNGEQIIRTAIDTFGRVDILINNAGILRDISFKNLSDTDWDLIMQVHVIGAYKCARAAFPYMREQKYGRIISTASAAGLFGSFGQTNYSAAKLAQVGFTESLAKEGLKYNIMCNTIAPIAASRLTATVMSEDILRRLQPEWVVPLVAFLCHSVSNSTGGIFEVGAGHIAQLRWERARGAYLRPDESYTQGALLQKWQGVVDFSQPEHPNGPADFAKLLATSESLAASPVSPGSTPDFKGRVAIVTGGGAGIGQAYSIYFARYGARVVVNDLADPSGTVDKIRAAGGQALGVQCSAESGAETVVKAAIDTFGRVDIVINNAGILRDAAFHKMTDKNFLDVLDVHLGGTYKVSKAAWPYMLKQKYGRIVNTTSTSGIYGNFGQANYAAAKCGILGFSRALALEGIKHNIKVNTVAPYAGTGLSRGALPDKLFKGFNPQHLCPLVGLLCSADSMPEPSTGGLYEAGGGWSAETRWQRSGGVAFPVDQPLTPEAVRQHWASITDFEDGRADHPREPADGTAKIMANLKDVDHASTKNGNQYLDKIAAQLKKVEPGTDFSWTKKDVVLYNLGIGAKHDELSLVFEGHDNFQVLPTYGVIPPFDAKIDYTTLVPNFKWTQVLHGEQYLEIRKFPIPTRAETVCYPKLVEVVDKGKAAAITTGCTVKDKKSGKDLFYTETLVFVRGAGNFGGSPKGSDRGAATRIGVPPQRAADQIIEEKTDRGQAALYRLSGDLNPLHIDPAFSKRGGFTTPILHGLCFFGIAGKAILKVYGRFRNIKVRFAGPVLPGQTVVTEMWKDNGSETITFLAKVKETGRLCISGGSADLYSDASSKL